VVEKPISAILMNCDNQTVIAKVNSANDNVKSTGHVKRHLKFVRKLRNSGVITVAYIQTNKNLADPFTKGLSRNVIEIASREMCVRPMLVCSSSNPTFLIGDPVTKDLGKTNYWQIEESIIITLSI
jgi:adenosylmethionine-8-amino-7-oxononanoate aminotransferase